jgi:predicted dehydrogenase
MSRTWLGHLAARSDAEVVALVDPVAANANARAQEHSLEVPRFADLASALAACDANVVCDITTPSAHLETAATAMLAGCDVLSEKPMATSAAEVGELGRVATEQGRSYAIMENRRYLAHVQAIQATLASGILGQLGLVNADFYKSSNFGGFRQEMANVLLMDMAIHTFYQARFMTATQPVAVLCHEFNPPWSWFRHGSSATAVFEMSNGIVFTYRGSWVAPGAETEWEAQWRIVGELGTLLWDGAAAPRIALADGSELEVPVEYAGRLGHDGALDEMFAALAGGRPSATDHREHAASLAMCFAAVASAESGRRVLLEPLL